VPHEALRQGAQPRGGRAWSWILGAAVTLAAFAFAFQKVYDGDTWWHLANGRAVLASGRVPRVDEWTFATAGTPWVSYQWLPAAGMYVVHRLGGVTLLVTTKALIVAAGWGLAFALSVRARANRWVAALVLIAALPLSADQFRDRPQILMFVLVPLYFWLLAEPGAERRPRTWIVLTAAQIAWANVHGSWFLGVALAGALLFQRTLEVAVAAVRGGEGRDLRGARRAAGLVATLVVASLFTPYGVALVRRTLEDAMVLGVAHSVQNQEFQPLVPGEHLSFVVWTLVAAASFLLPARRARPFVGAAAAGFTLLAFGSVRFVAIAALLLASVIAWNVSAWWAAVAESSTAARLRSFRAVELLGPWAALLLLCGLSVAAHARTFGPGREWQFGAGVNEGRFPRRAIEYLAQLRFDGNLFNSWSYGGYVLWNLPGVKYMVDGRSTPAQMALMDGLGAMDRDALERWLGEHDVRGALLTRDDPFRPLFSESSKYGAAFFDDRSVVFLRKDLLEKETGAGARYRFIRPEATDPEYLVSVALGPQAADAEAELRAAVAEAPASFLPRFLLGRFLEAQGRAEALDHYAAAARLSPGLAFAHNQLGRRAGAFALNHGLEARAEQVLRDAVAMVPGDFVQAGMLGAVLQVQGKNVEAEPLLRKALAAAPDLHAVAQHLGLLLLATGRPQEAEQWFRRILAANPGDPDAAQGLERAKQAAR
jgi:tetratricopeptide (TPR) repeat protein